MALSLKISDLELYKRTANLIGFTYLSIKKTDKAIEAFKKLRDAAYEDKDIITKQYAYS